MAESWVRLWAGSTTDPKFLRLHDEAKIVYAVAFKIAFESSTCYPNWRDVEVKSGFSSDAFLMAFDELCEAGIVFHGFPSLLVALSARFPLAPMFGPVAIGRPSAEVWMVIRKRIFARDDYTCVYCGARGGVLECDHVIPVSRGGHHGDDNLVTACFACNRSKRDKLVDEWRPE